jgi:hypothetical protein
LLVFCCIGRYCSLQWVCHIMVNLLHLLRAPHFLHPGELTIEQQLCHLVRMRGNRQSGYRPARQSTKQSMHEALNLR